MRGFMMLLLVAVALGQLVMEEEGVFKEQRYPWDMPKKCSEAITIPAETQVTIDLPSTPSTGYSWKWTNNKLLGRKLRSLNKKTSGVYIPPEEALVGASGRQTFSFEAPTPGTDTLVFEYKRPWEKKANIVYTVKVTIE